MIVNPFVLARKSPIKNYFSSCNHSIKSVRNGLKYSENEKQQDNICNKKICQ